MKKYYTPEEDKIILNAEWGELPLIAERFHRSLGAIRQHRRFLVHAKNEIYNGKIVRKPIKTKPAAPRRNIPSPFHRPAWFEENLTQMTRGAL